MICDEDDGDDSAGLLKTSTRTKGVGNRTRSTIIARLKSTEN